MLGREHISVPMLGSVWSGGVGCCGVEARGVCERSIIRNSFGYIAISIVLNRKASYYIIAEKWLKRNKSISGILCEGRSEIGESVCWVCGVVLSTAVRRFLYSRAVVSVKQTTQTPINML